ncbi:synaptosomal-associated protein 47 [Triplophysa dalaica]|uniref:synaptosomal-associated protein 47 n=1 Tax=Triplophysa dalaica TaxID=1582913 RepID=UPI0024DF8BCE|nr:synaptosomal-associated protein 47 [Triplophysa dalaica]XP_056599017.1 synaptosomal-associated protein 47 [Triplophysa dalaica]
MSQHVSIHSWSGSYYIKSEKRWVSGTLSLTRTTLLFTSEQNQESLASLRLSRIMEIKMESSSFIFSTLTVLEQGNIKHWFGSLKPCRAAVYHVLEHFWRERLLSPTEPHGAEAPLSKGQELISLISGAQRRLEDTGKVLQHQGEQFDNMAQGLEKIESDLNVADKLLSELECPSWWPFGKLPWKSHQEAKSEAAAKSSYTRGAGKGQKVITSIPAIISQVGSTGDMKPGSLTVLVSSLEIRDANGQLLHLYEREEVDDIRVHNPYEISVRQRFIGRPDICFRVLSAKMVEALSVLEMQYKKKIEFTRDYAVFQMTPTTTPGSPEGALNIWSAGHGQDTDVPVEVPAGELTQLQLQVLQPTVTEAEAQELKQMLQQLKSLALEAETELERQDEALDVLGSSTDHTTMNINRHTRRMRKLM